MGRLTDFSLKSRFYCTLLEPSGVKLSLPFQTMLYVGIVVYAPAIALSSVTSLPWWGAVLLLGICATFYTTVGGLKAIVWTDVFQIFIMYGGILAIVIRGIIEVGGIQNVW